MRQSTTLLQLQTLQTGLFLSVQWNVPDTTGWPHGHGLQPTARAMAKKLPTGPTFFGGGYIEFALGINKISPKLNCHQNWNVTKTEISSKLKYHQKLNVTKTNSLDWPWLPWPFSVDYQEALEMKGLEHFLLRQQKRCLDSAKSSFKYPDGQTFFPENIDHC